MLAACSTIQQVRKLVPKALGGAVVDMTTGETATVMEMSTRVIEFH